MRAYYLAMALIIFNLSLPVASSLGISAPAGQEIPTIFEGVNILDWKNLIKIGLGALITIGLASVVGLKLNLGAVVFAIVFFASALPFEATLNWLSASYGLAPSVVALVWGGILFVFTFAFIQLCSAPVEHD